VAEDLDVTRGLSIPGRELSWSAVRAGGPGGQNVNKVSTRVELRFDPAQTRALSAPVRSRLLRLAKGRLDAEGRIVVSSDQTRSQARNLELARQRLRELLLSALREPKRRRPTRPTQKSRARRLDDKRREGEKKARRRPQRWE
jgi:ribosome-associated protein